MPPKVVTPKVLCYIVHKECLLVFRHRDHSFEQVGIQVPAGTIRPGESPEAAALREAHEETSLTGIAIVRKLGETRYDISPTRFEIQHRHVFLMALKHEPPDRWMSSEDHDGIAPPTTFECFWIPLANAHVLQSGQGALVGTLFD